MADRWCWLRVTVVLSILLLGAGSRGRASDASVSQPQPPLVEQKTFRLADPALRIELIAAEPQVASPVAIAWDADGALFVAEMIDYPVSPPSGRIRRLADRDGDGVYEHATCFADGLPFPNGVLPCFGGVLVTAAPDILFLKDRDGDGRADERRTVLTGFGEGNTQLRVNGLFWGLDNWIYAANGRSDGEIRAPGASPEKAVSIRRRDLRFWFRPERADVPVQAIAGFSQFGLAHDDHGNRFPSWNTIPLRHVVLEQEVLDRNPHLAETSSVASILDESDGGRVYSISPVQARFNQESIDYFNASCGPTIFRGDRLPAAYRGHAFVCEPLTNLVHRRVLEPAGCTFLARRVEQEREFLASTDPAFRPVNLATGPDGALYVVDMYRELVEHPDFVPPDMRPKIEFRRWHDRGRIWRIMGREPAEVSEAGRRPRLSGLPIEELARRLNHPVGWVRDTAQRLLVERQDRQVIPLLVAMLQERSEPLGRLHALWTLSGLGAVDTSVLDRVAGDPDPVLREHALRVAAAHPPLARKLPRQRLLAMAGDPAVRVRLQAAILLGDMAPTDRDAVRALAELARQDEGDRWIRLAVLSGLGEAAVPFLTEWAGSLDTATPEQLRLLAEAAAIMGVRRRNAEIDFVVKLLRVTLPQGDGVKAGLDSRLALAAGLGEGLERSGLSLTAWLGQQTRSKPEGASHLASLWLAAQARAGSDAPVERRRLALEALVHGAPEQAGPLVARLIGADQPPPLQLAAARVAGQICNAATVEAILEDWGKLALGTRRALLASLTATPAHAAAVIAAIEDQKLAVTELDAASRDVLLRFASPPQKERLEAVLARFAPADRSAVVQRYQAALQLPGDRERGAILFAKNCQTCHERQGQGHRVGPDLSGIAGRPPAVLLGDILHPNRDVAPDYVALSVATRSGQVLSGLLVEETASGVKLRQAEGVEQTILRSEIAEIRSSGRSLMPEGLEQTLNFQEMADLLAFLRAGTR